MDKYILVLWPYSQEYMDHPRFNECYLCQALDEQEHFDSAYFVPIDLYTAVNDRNPIGV